MRKSSIFMLGVSAFGLFSHTSAASAQEVAHPAPAQDQHVEEAAGDIIVTAQKRSERLRDVGMSITAATGDTLLARGVTGPDKLALIEPTFVFARSSYGAPVYTLRGVGFYDTAIGATPAVTVYQDQVPIPYSIMSKGVGFDVERVEVLKGPQGTLFGQNSTGGAVNYVSAKPTSATDAGIDVTAGRFGAVNSTVFLSGPLTDTLRARVSLYTDQSGDWQRSYTRNDSLGRRNILFGRSIVDWNATPNLFLRATISAGYDRSDSQAGQLIAVTFPGLNPAVVNYPLAPANARAADWDANQSFRLNDHQVQGSLSAEWSLGAGLQVRSITSYQTFTGNQRSDVDGTSYDVFLATSAGKIDTFYQELLLQNSGRGIAKWTIGANYSHDKIDDSLGSEFPASRFGLLGFNSADPHYKQRVDTKAVFADLELKVSERFSVQAGARYTSQDRHFSGCTYDSGDGTFAGVVSAIFHVSPAIPAGGCGTLNASFKPQIIDSTLSEDNVSWRLGAKLKLTTDSLVYASISKGYKAGAFPTSGASSYLSLFPAKQESLLSYEAGFKLSALDHGLSLNGAVFYYDYRDKQILGRIIDPIVGSLNRLINIPKSHELGAELALTATPTRGLTLSLSGAYLDSKIEAPYTNVDALGNVRDLSGNPYPYTSKWSGSAGVRYETALTDKLNVFGSIDTNYKSRSNAGLGQIQLFELNARALVDVQLGVETPGGRWRVALWGHNILNKYYWNNVVTATTDTVVRYAEQPATYGVSLRYRM